MPSEVNTALLAKLVQRQVARSVNLREAAKEAGVSPATLSRVQRGHAPDTDALVALARWLQIPIEKVLHDPPAIDTPRDGSTPEKVEVHLRADPVLSAETAARLADVFRALYEEFVASDAARAGQQSGKRHEGESTEHPSSNPNPGWRETRHR
jgi:transcriptional regulator with XRE-family HTH domain